jgi:hypothetical protein
MHRPAKTGKPRRTGKARLILTWASLGLCAGLTGAGCSTTAQTTAQATAGDPLLGPTPPPSTLPVQAAPANAEAWLAPIPPSSGVATNATLASQTPPPRSLAIGEAPPGGSWQRNIDGAPATSNVLKAPITPASQIHVEPVPKDNSFTAAPGQAIQPAGSWAVSSPSPAAGPSLEQLKQALDVRHVIGQQQENVPGGIHLRCVVTNPANPNANQIYETTAADYATAVQAIVQQIDRP